MNGCKKAGSICYAEKWEKVDVSIIYHGGSGVGGGNAGAVQYGHGV